MPLVPISTGGNSAISFVLIVASMVDLCMLYILLVSRRKQNLVIEKGWFVELLYCFDGELFHKLWGIFLGLKRHSFTRSLHLMLFI